MDQSENVYPLYRNGECSCPHAFERNKNKPKERRKVYPVLSFLMENQERGDLLKEKRDNQFKEAMA